MILKNYQKRVLDDLSGYLAALEKTKNLKEAFRQHWAERGVAIGFHGMQPYNNLLPGVPHVCLKVPTGGGKTLLGCASLRRIFDSMGITKTKAVVWLVPSTSILDQTARALSSVEHPYRQWLDYDFGSRVEIYNSEQAKNGQNLTPSTVREQLSVFVMGYDSLRIKKKEGRKAYQENGALAQFVPHFTQPDALLPDVDESALIQVLGQMNPVVVVDESHNATSELSVEMLKNLNPSFVLDLTATPRQNSNIISIVDAREMKRENMVKLPVIVYNRHTKQDVLTDAIQLRGSIERQAKVAEASGGQYIRPIVLFQAQPKGKESSATFEKLKAALVDMGIPKEEIAIKTSEVNELKHVELMSRTCPIRYIITVNALKEGWDCPFAYILATLANRTSQVDVEQIVGRILRLPYTEKHSQPLLNMSYVLTCSNDFSATLQNVIKGLNRAGFSEREFRVGSEAEPEPEKPEKTPAQQSIDDVQTGPEEEFLDFDFAAARQRLEESAGDMPSPAVQDMTLTAEQTGAAFEAEMNDLDDLPLMGGGEMRRHIQMQAEFAEEAQALRLPMFVEQIEASLFSEAM
ncbi:MAG: DEAD/DEAH box helicase family protein, partial [Clostridia bacterium]|nr:DEAD/DEAH box helicase family protein [Clostridia bacterium]